MSAQSTLHATGVEAQVVEKIWWIMLAGGTLVLLLVLGILFYALLRDPDRRARIDTGRFIFAGGVALPTIALTALLIYTLVAGGRLRASTDPVAVEVDVVGHQWWWDVRYRGADPQRWFATANELHLPVDATTRVRVWTADVIHSFWVPNLAGKIDLLPERKNEILLQPTRTGVSRGQCAEFCGAQHALMALDVVVHSAEDFEAWRERQLRPAALPTDALAREGHDVFMRGGCANCHAIRGTEARGSFGPDLTRVGARRSLAAGTLPLTSGSLAAWILQAQHFKPGSRMPSFDTFSGDELAALAAYLEGLK